MTSVDEEMAACGEKPFRLFQWSNCKQTAATKTAVKGPAARKKPAATKAMKGAYANTKPAAALDVKKKLAASALDVKKKPAASAHKRSDKSDDAVDEDAGEESHESRETLYTDEFDDPCEPDLRRLSTLELMRLPTLEFGSGATRGEFDPD